MDTTERRLVIVMTSVGFLAGLFDADPYIGDAFAGAAFIFVLCVVAVWIVD